MRWSADDVRHLATLARLRLDDGRAERVAGELARILAYVEQLGEGDACEPAGTTPLRPDVAIARAIPVETADPADGLVHVPPVMPS